MRIECPGCEATYEVPDTQIRPGRSVRCARCAVQWRPAGDPPAPESPAEKTAAIKLRQSGAPAAEATPAPGATRSDQAAIPAVPGPAGGAAGWRVGWAASLIVLAGLLVSAAHWRAPIMQHWPPSIRLYTVLGAPPPRS